MNKSIKKNIPKNFDILLLVIVNLLFLLFLLYKSDLKNNVLYLLLLLLLLQINIKFKYTLLVTLILTSLFYLYKKNKMEGFGEGYEKSIDLDSLNCDDKKLKTELSGYFGFINDEDNIIEGVNRNEIVLLGTNYINNDIDIEKEIESLSQESREWITNNVINYKEYKEKCKKKDTPPVKSENPLEILKNNSDKLDTLNTNVKKIMKLIID